MISMIIINSAVIVQYGLEGKKGIGGVGDHAMLGGPIISNE